MGISNILDQNKKEKEYGNEFLNDLMDFIDEQEVQELDIALEKEGFEITNDEQANYFVKKIKEMRQEKEEISATAKKQIEDFKEKVQQWEEETTRPLENNEEYYLSLLENYGRKKLAGSKKKSFKLIEGTVGFRAQQPKLEYDDKALLEFLQNNASEYVKYTPSPDKNTLKKEGEIKEDGLYIENKKVEGVEVTFQEDKFDVK